MTRQDELASSREGLLRNGEESPTRVSSDDYSSSSELDLHELELLEAVISWWIHPPGGEIRSPPVYPSPKGGTLPQWAQSYEKAALLVERMTLIEKVNITTGTGWAQDLCVGNTAPAYGVGFPPLCLQDGPLGVRFADHATAWPAGITVGATWNKDLMYKRGRGLGLEHRLKGVNVWLGPSMGPLGRMPGGGRNWEGFGPDPVLQGFAASLTIKGAQDEGVIATAKHYIANEQEHFRQAHEWILPNAISSNIGDRTMHEVYLWPFAESVRAGVASVMCSYNMVNNSYACGNSKLMNGILKDELGFQGFVQSDWLAQRSGAASALAGLDMTMPGDGLRWQDGQSLWGSKLTEAVLNSSVPVERLDDMVTRIVAAWYQLGQDDVAKWPALPDGGPNFSSWTDEKIGKIHPDSDDDTTAVVNHFVDVQGEGDTFHGRLAQQIAAEGTCLVKNVENILPLDSKGDSMLMGTRRDGKYRVGVFGEDAASNPKGNNACPDRACNDGTLASGWGSGSVEFPFLVSPIEALQSYFDLTSVEITQNLTNDLSAKWPESLGSQDLCIVFVNSDAGEGYTSWNGVTDRTDLHPQKGGDSLVKNVQDQCVNTIVVVHAVGPVILERWVDLPNVKAVILANLPGEESGNALADVLFGKVDASGRLPYTVGKSLSDYGPGGQIMTKPNGLAPQQDFDEGLLIDYRHFDKHNITPRYEFGFGLSYTTFTFTDLEITTLKPKSPLPSPRPDQTILPPTYPTTLPDSSSAVFPPGFRKLHGRIYPYLDNSTVKEDTSHYPEGWDTHLNPSPAGGGEGGNPSLYDEHALISVKVTNTGSRTGKQVVQVYVSFPETIDVSTGKKIDFPVRVLRGFEKVDLREGETALVEVRLTRKDLSYWSVGRQNWVMPDGDISVSVGASSRDLPLSGVL
ncbi:beta-glucosidase, partial [Lecanoromycetidae sp. Uapishka_2]